MNARLAVAKAAWTTSFNEPASTFRGKGYSRNTAKEQGGSFFDTISWWLVFFWERGEVSFSQACLSLSVSCLFNCSNDKHA